MTDLNLSQYEQHLAIERARRSQGELNLALFNWDPDEHPRNLLGRFAAKLSDLKPGGAITTRDGVKVHKTTDSSPRFYVTPGGTVGTALRNKDEADRLIAETKKTSDEIDDALARARKLRGDAAPEDQNVARRDIGLVGSDGGSIADRELGEGRHIDPTDTNRPVDMLHDSPEAAADHALHESKLTKYTSKSVEIAKAAKPYIGPLIGAVVATGLAYKYDGKLQEESDKVADAAWDAMKGISKDRSKASLRKNFGSWLGTWADSQWKRQEIKIERDIMSWLVDQASTAGMRKGAKLANAFLSQEVDVAAYEEALEAERGRLAG